MAKMKSTANEAQLAAALAALRSDDVLTQNEGVTQAIQLGSAAIPDLLALFEEPGAHRAQVAYALSEIGDARAEPAFSAGLHAADARVRAYSAQGLVRLGDPRAMTACLNTLNDAADKLHGDITPSVLSLGEMGLKPVPFLLDFLMDQDELTRLHSQRALEMIVMRRYGFRPGQGFPTPAAQEQAAAAWHDHGDYDYAADAATRNSAVKQLRAWFDTLKE